MEVGLWDGQLQHIRRLHIRHHFEGRHQLRQIEEFCKTGFRAIAAALRGKLDGGNGFTVVAGPIVEVDKTHLLQGLILQVPLHRIQFHHTVGDRGAGGEDNTVAVGQLVQILTLGKEIRGLLRFRLRDTADIAHFRHQKEIFETMALIDEQPVDAQLLKGYGVVLGALIVELLQPRLQ